MKEAQDKKNILRPRVVYPKEQKEKIIAIFEAIYLPDISDNSIYCFIDETGNEDIVFSPKFFALGGLCVTRAEYNSRIKPEWKLIKSDVFKVPANKPFRAKKHLAKLEKRPTDVARLINWIHRRRRRFIGSCIPPTALVSPNARTLRSCLDGLNAALDNSIHGKSTDCTWIFETSARLSFKTINDAVDVLHRPQKRRKHDFYFMQKLNFEPGLEIADLVSYVINHYIRPNTKSKDDFVRRLARAMFFDTEPPYTFVWNTHIARVAKRL